MFRLIKYIPILIPVIRGILKDPKIKSALAKSKTRKARTKRR